MWTFLIPENFAIKHQWINIFFFNYKIKHSVALYIYIISYKEKQIIKKKLLKILYFSQNPGRELAVNAPVFTLLIRDRGCAIKTGFSEPLKFHFKQKVKDNRTSPQCVYWKTSTHNVCNHTDSGSDHRFVSCLYEENSVSICRFQKSFNLVPN